MNNQPSRQYHGNQGLRQMRPSNGHVRNPNPMNMRNMSQRHAHIQQASQVQMQHPTSHPSMAHPTYSMLPMQSPTRSMVLYPNHPYVPMASQACVLPYFQVPTYANQYSVGPRPPQMTQGQAMLGAYGPQITSHHTNVANNVNTMMNQHTNAGSNINNVQATSSGRVEVNAAWTYERKKKGKKMKIVNPETGQEVDLGDHQPSPNTGNTSSGNDISMMPHSNNNVAAAIEPEIAPKLEHETKAEHLDLISHRDTISSEEVNDSTKKQKEIKSLFFTKISGAASDMQDTTSSNSGPDNSKLPPLQAAGDLSEEKVTLQPQSPSPKPREVSAVPEQVVMSPVPTPQELSPQNASEKDYLDMSADPVSPTPMEFYDKETPKSSRDSSTSAPAPRPQVSEKIEPSDIEKLTISDASVSKTEVLSPVEQVMEEKVETVTENGSMQHEIDATSSPIESTSTVDDKAEDVITTATPAAVNENKLADKICVAENVEKQEEALSEESMEPSTELNPADQTNGELGTYEEGEIPETAQDDAYVEDDVDDRSPCELSDTEDDVLKTKEKITYDREFLMNIGERVRSGKADVNEDLAKVLKDLQAVTKNTSQGMGSLSRDYRMNRAKQGLDRRGPYGGGGIPNWGHSRGGPFPIPPSFVPNQKVIDLGKRSMPPLNKAENPWKPSALMSKPVSTDKEAQEKEEIEHIKKKVRAIFNKVTPDNFSKLSEKFSELSSQGDKGKIDAIIAVVFEKALDEPAFSTTYAKMIHYYCNKYSETADSFRRQLLDACQSEFNKTTAEEDEFSTMEETIEEAEGEEKERLKSELELKKTKSRRRSLGNVRFIGELYKLGMLTSKIQVFCVDMLLKAEDEESLECLCKLLTTIGDRLDNSLKQIEKRSKEMEKVPNWAPEPDWMKHTFNKVKTLSSNKSLSSRIRFALLDVVELRENNWKPRRDSNAPKTINQVREDALKEEMEEKKQLSSLPNPTTERHYTRPNSGSYQWNQVPSSRSSSKSSYVSNKSTRFVQQRKDLPPPKEINLAPRSGDWNPSSSGRSNFSPHMPPIAQTNRYQKLSEMQEPSREPPKASLRYADPSHRLSSPMGSNASSRENSRPVSPVITPKEPSRSASPVADVSERVKNIFEEYCQNNKFEDTRLWINERFPGQKISEFIDELARKVCDMNKDGDQLSAATLIRSLIRQKCVSKEVVMTTIRNGVLEELPDICLDAPKALSYFGRFLGELFYDESDLTWLLSLINVRDGENSSNFEELITCTLNKLKMKLNEVAVVELFKKTPNRELIPVQNVPWIGKGNETVDSMSQKMIPVLKSSSNPKQIQKLFQDHSWDLRQELPARSLTEAICTISYSSTGWNTKTLGELLGFAPLPHEKWFPDIWKQAKTFCDKNQLRKDQEDQLWKVLHDKKWMSADVRKS